jgi:hypothetical protein
MMGGEEGEIEGRGLASGDGVDASWIFAMGWDLVGVLAPRVAEP